MSDAEVYLEVRTGAALRSIRVLNELLEVALRALEVEDAIRHDLAMGVAELVANVCEHEYEAGPLRNPDGGDVGLRLDGTSGEIRLTVTSQGPPFDLGAALDRARNHDPLEALEGSGLGLRMLDALFDAIDHAYEQEVGNLITLRRAREQRRTSESS